jgi:hypothetical protein
MPQLTNADLQAAASLYHMCVGWGFEVEELSVRLFTQPEGTTFKVLTTRCRAPCSG